MLISATSLTWGVPAFSDCHIAPQFTCKQQDISTFKATLHTLQAVEDFLIPLHNDQLPIHLRAGGKPVSFEEVVVPCKNLLKADRLTTRSQVNGQLVIMQRD